MLTGRVIHSCAVRAAAFGLERPDDGINPPTRQPGCATGVRPGIIQRSCTLGRGGRAVYCTGLENRRAVRLRGFESHPLRHGSYRSPFRLDRWGRFPRTTARGGSVRPPAFPLSLPSSRAMTAVPAENPHHSPAHRRQVLHRYRRRKFVHWFKRHPILGLITTLLAAYLAYELVSRTIVYSAATVT